MLMGENFIPAHHMQLIQLSRQISFQTQFVVSRIFTFGNLVIWGIPCPTHRLITTLKAACMANRRGELDTLLKPHQARNSNSLVPFSQMFSPDNK